MLMPMLASTDNSQTDNVRMTPSPVFMIIPEASGDRAARTPYGLLFR
jgi:hypothetical protein